MKLSIVTINFNDAVGLKRTLDSVVAQSIATSPSSHLAVSPIELEHIIIDGASTDGSVDVIKEYEKRLMEIGGTLTGIGVNLKWLSEPDHGIYNAMNKGIKMATGDYIQILNSGDILASDDVIVRMNEALSIENTKRLNASSDADKRLNVNTVDILYGNMLKAMPKGKIVRDNCGGVGACESFLYFYKGTLNHDCTWIKRSLFDKFGLYDEEMKICSDWKWYVNAIALGYNPSLLATLPSSHLAASPVHPIYVDIDVTIFDMNGISESGGKNKALIQKERREYLEQVLPASVLRDYDEFAMPIEQYCRLKQYHLWGMVYFIERVLFKLEKWRILR